jgi:periplasmic glucans biosynthesis protein
MNQSIVSGLKRRTFLWAAAAALLSTTALSRTAFASETFDFDVLTDRMRAKAAEPFGADLPKLAPVYADMDYDGYRKFQFDTGRARWADSAAGYQIHAFPMGWLFREPVDLVEVADGAILPFDFGLEDFQIHDAAVKAAAIDEPFPGIAGFRVNYPINRPDSYDELISFLGASYFRALGRDNIYGLSARGLIINSWLDGPEEFPRFSEFYLERPAHGAALVAYAALEGPSVAGAYRFEIVPGNDAAQETTIDVTARLFFRADVAELGVAPLTSMFLFAEANRAGFDDYRPQVHDSNGLMLTRQDGEVYWRPLSNTPGLGNSYFWESNPKAFGLYQRGREFETYQDAGAHYERRPSVRVEPIGDWGQGSIRLIEVPSKLEADDNIVAFWIPSEPVKAGDSREYRYRLSWGNLDPDPAGELAYVVETRGGQGGISGIENDAALRKFVIDFKGDVLDAMADPTRPFDIVATAVGGSLVSSAVSKVEANGVWRVALDVMIESDAPVELKAYLVGGGKRVTETWLYQWRKQA